eukprot:COSAG06_NODE_2429_length_6891_cov_159.822733_1_plen_87_part_00
MLPPDSAAACGARTPHTRRIKKAINATCLYRHIDVNIEAVGKACFDQCPADPTGMTDCYLKCYCEPPTLAPSSLPSSAVAPCCKVR